MIYYQFTGCRSTYHRPLSLYAGLLWKSLALLIMHKAQKTKALCLQPPVKLVVNFICFEREQKVSNSRGGTVATHLLKKSVINFQNENTKG